MTIAASRRSFLLSSGALIGAGLLNGCETTPSPAPAPRRTVVLPTPGVPAQIPPPFPMIVDASARIDATKAKALRTQGVRTVFRYYCQLPPSIPGKDLQPEEAKIILNEGLSLGAVFQHYNNCFRTFENRWGKEDAQQALKMAEAIG